MRERVARRIVEIIHDVMNVSSSHGADWRLLALYLARSAQRAGDEVEKEIRRGMARISLVCRTPPLFDLYHIAEISERR